LAEDVADVLPVGVHGVFRVVDEHPLGEERSAAGDDADEAIFDILEVGTADAGVDGEVVNTLAAWWWRRTRWWPVEVFELLSDDHRVNRDGADGDGGVLAEGLAAVHRCRRLSRDP